MLRFLFIFCFICFIENNVVAQTQGYEYSDSSLLDNNDAASNNDGIPVNPNKEEIITDTILYTHDVAVPLDSVTAWKNDPKYAYVKNLDSLLKAREREYASQGRGIRQDSPAPSNTFFSSGIVQAFFWAIAVFMVVFILYKLFSNQGIFRKNRSALPVKEIEEDDHNIDHASDYDALIQQSVKQEDFRMAVRYLFLKTLRQLADRGHLQRSADKTNYQYVQQISQAKKKDFASLVLNYEYVWYGHLDIARDQFEQIEKNYTSFLIKFK